MTKYETKLRVQYYETDAMGIVHHSNYIRFFETARTEFFRSRGYSYDAMEKAGVWMPVHSVTADFKAPAVYDEEILVACWIEKLKGASIELGYEVRGAETGELYTKGTSSHGFTTADLKPIRLKKEAPDIYNVLKAAMD
ncbi:MAG: thioesterase family protein [Bacillota bacterium]|nr:thioesterase family protein [Bacillota bacterium]